MQGAGAEETAQKVIVLPLQELRPKTEYQTSNPNPEAWLCMPIALELEVRHRQNPRTPSRNGELPFIESSYLKSCVCGGVLL